MASARQKKAARKNIVKAQRKWKSMSPRARAIAQPQGRARKKPGTGGSGNFYRVVVRPKSEFVSFRNQDVGSKGGIERIAGRRKSGSWATQVWLIERSDAKVEGKTLVGKTSAVKKLLSTLSRKPKKLKGDIFEAGPRKNIPEKSKPTKAMRVAQKKNIKKARAAWRRMHK